MKLPTESRETTLVLKSQTTAATASAMLPVTSTMLPGTSAMNIQQETLLYNMHFDDPEYYNRYVDRETTLVLVKPYWSTLVTRIRTCDLTIHSRQASTALTLPHYAESCALWCFQDAPASSSQRVTQTRAGTSGVCRGPTYFVYTTWGVSKGVSLLYASAILVEPLKTSWLPKVKLNFLISCNNCNCSASDTVSVASDLTHMYFSDEEESPEVVLGPAIDFLTINEQTSRNKTRITGKRRRGLF